MLVFELPNLGQILLPSRDDIDERTLGIAARFERPSECAGRAPPAGRER